MTRETENESRDERGQNQRQGDAAKGVLRVAAERSGRLFNRRVNLLQRRNTRAHRRGQTADGVRGENNVRTADERERFAIKNERAANGEQNNAGSETRARAPHSNNKAAENDVGEPENGEGWLKDERDPRCNGGDDGGQIVAALPSPPHRERFRDKEDEFAREQIKRHKREQ